MSALSTVQLGFVVVAALSAIGIVALVISDWPNGEVE